MRYPIAAALAVTALLNAPAAQADPVANYAYTVAPAVCATLDDVPTFDGIVGVALGVVADTGWTFADAGRVIREAVELDCPYHLPLLGRFHDTYAPNPPYVA